MDVSKVYLALQMWEYSIDNLSAYELIFDYFYQI